MAPNKGLDEGIGNVSPRRFSSKGSFDVVLPLVLGDVGLFLEEYLYYLKTISNNKIPSSLTYL